MTNDLSYNRLSVLATTASTFDPLLPREQNGFGHFKHKVWHSFLLFWEELVKPPIESVIVWFFSFGFRFSSFFSFVE